jgi:outer membrane receptor protein involved in Fe transport
METYPVTFTNEDWSAFSPKAGIRYSVHPNLSVFTSFATGFRPPMLDDMCTNRSITKGFKIANPQLKPEVISSVEIGADVLLWKKIIIQPSLYSSIGTGFHYFVATGDSVDTGGDALKPVLIRDNIASVSIKGAELLISYSISKSLNLIANYAFAYSIISEFSNARYEDQNLEGKFLMEVPPHQCNASLQYINKYLTATLTFVFVDKQWFDDENTTYTDAYHYFNIRIASDIIKNFQIALTCNDIFDQQFVNNKGFLSPGRFFMGSLSYKFTKK